MLISESHRRPHTVRSHSAKNVQKKHLWRQTVDKKLLTLETWGLWRTSEDRVEVTAKGCSVFLLPVLLRHNWHMHRISLRCIAWKIWLNTWWSDYHNKLSETFILEYRYRIKEAGKSMLLVMRILRIDSKNFHVTNSSVNSNHHIVHHIPSSSLSYN